MLEYFTTISSSSLGTRICAPFVGICTQEPRGCRSIEAQNQFRREKLTHCWQHDTPTCLTELRSLAREKLSGRRHANTFSCFGHGRTSHEKHINGLRIASQDITVQHSCLRLDKASNRSRQQRGGSQHKGSKEVIDNPDHLGTRKKSREHCNFAFKNDES